MANAKRDENMVPTILGISSVDGTPVPIKVNPVTNRLLIELVGGSVGDMQSSTYDPAGISEQLVGLTATQTLTNKTLDLTDNTLSGTKSEFNTALSDDDFVFLGEDNTLTGNNIFTKNVGIGTVTTPSATLHLEKTSSINRLLIKNTGTATYDQASLALDSGGYSYIYYVNAGEDKFNIWSDTTSQGIWSMDKDGNQWSKGNMQVGGSEGVPYRTFNVHTDTTSILNIKATGATPYSSRIEFGDDADVDVGYIEYLHGSNDIRFVVNTAEKMRLKSSGVLNLSSAPTSSTGLSTGDIWNNGGVLNIV